MGLYTTALIKILQTIDVQNFDNKTLCMLGKQGILIEWNSFMKIIDRMGLYYNKKIYSQIGGVYPIDSYMFFNMFGIKEVHAVDYTDSEGADIIINLNEELLHDLYEKFDYIIDGGTLEHVFDIATAIKNVSLMLKTGGTIIHILPLGGYVDHGFYSFSPTFFMDFYCSNGYRIDSLNMEFMFGNMDYQSYGSLMAIYSQDCRLFQQDYRDWANVSLNHYIKKISSLEEIGHIYLWCIAKKLESRLPIVPIQGMYQERDLDGSSDLGINRNKKEIDWDQVLIFLKKNIKRKVALFAAGMDCNYVINILHQNDMENIVHGIFDHDLTRAGTLYRGYRIFYPTESKLKNIDVILICSCKYEDEIYNSLLSYGIKEDKIYKITEL